MAADSLQHASPDHPPSQQAAGGGTGASEALRRAAAWWLLSSIGACALAILAAQTPPRLRLLGPFSLGLSLLTACLLDQAAGWTGMSSRRILLGLGAILIAAVPVGTTCLLHRQETAILAKQYRNSAAPLVANTPAAGAFENADAARQQVAMARKAQEMVRQERERVLSEQTRFSAFLKRRLANVERAAPKFSPAAAVVAWLAEMLVATAGGVWLLMQLWRMRRQPASNVDDGGSGG